MPYFDIIWNLEDEDGNVAHIAEHGLTPDDVEHVLADDCIRSEVATPWRRNYADAFPAE